MLLLRNVILAVGVCTLICVLPLHADDLDKAETAAGQAETKAKQSHNRLADALLKFIDTLEQDAKKADATTDEKMGAVRYQEARGALEAGKFRVARRLILIAPPVLGQYQEVFDYVFERLDNDERIAATEELQQQRYDEVVRGVASHAKETCNLHLVQMQFRSYQAWGTLLDYLNEPTCRPDGLVMTLVADIANAERQRYPVGEKIDPEKISESFDKRLNAGELGGLGALVALEMQKAPKGAEVERMKLRLILRLALRQPDFIRRHDLVGILAEQFTSAARRRMALGEYDAARLLASDALPLNIAIKSDADSPSKILADIQSRVAVTSSQGTSPNDGTVEGRRKGNSPANLMLNSSFEEGTAVPDYWQRSQPLAGVTWKWDKEVGFQSKSSLCLEKTAPRYFPIAEWYQTRELDPDFLEIHVGVQVKAEKLAKGVIDVSFLDQAGNPLHHKWVAYIGEEKGGPPITHDWKLFEADVDVPPDTKTCRVSLQIYGPGKVWFDDVSLFPIAKKRRASEANGTRGAVFLLPKPQQNADGPSSLNVQVSSERVEEFMGRIKLELLAPDEKEMKVESKIVNGKSVIYLAGPGRRIAQIYKFITELERSNRVDDSTLRQKDPIDEEMNRKTEQLAKQVRESTGAEREKLKQDLERLVEEHFKQRQARRTKEIDDLARRVDQMREVQQIRQANQAEILKRRIEDLLDEDSLKWNETKPSVTRIPSVAAPISATPALSQTETLEKKAALDLDASNEPTFDGVNYSAWLKILERDRNPERVFDAVRALKEMPREQDATQLARGIFRFSHSLPLPPHKDASGIYVNHVQIANEALQRLPAEPVIETMIREIREEGQYLGSRQLVQALTYELTPVFKESIASHAREIIKALIESKGYSRQEVFYRSISLLTHAKLRPRDIPGLAPLFSKILKDEESLVGKGQLSRHSALGSIARLDPEFPEVVEEAVKIPNELRAAWDDVLKSPDGRSLVMGFAGFSGGGMVVGGTFGGMGGMGGGMGGMGGGGLGGGGSNLNGYPKLQNCAYLVQLLVPLKSVHQEALPLLKEISATEWPKTKAFETVQKEALTDFKRKVDEAIKSIEASVAMEVKP